MTSRAIAARASRIFFPACMDLPGSRPEPRQRRSPEPEPRPGRLGAQRGRGFADRGDTAARRQPLMSDSPSRCGSVKRAHGVGAGQNEPIVGIESAQRAIERREIRLGAESPCTGTSTGSAPSARSPSLSLPAWCAARVTSTRRPASGSAVIRRLRLRIAAGRKQCALLQLPSASAAASRPSAAGSLFSRSA